MTEYDPKAITIGSLAGVIFSVSMNIIGLSGPGILTSNIIAGFIATYTSQEKGGYIINGGASGIISSLIMMALGFLLSKTVFGFTNWDTLGLLSLGLSVGGAGFFLGIIGGYAANRLSK